MKMPKTIADLKRLKTVKAERVFTGKWLSIQIELGAFFYFTTTKINFLGVLVSLDIRDPDLVTEGGPYYNKV